MCTNAMHRALAAFANDLSDHLKTLAERASIEVQESYEEVVDDVFSEYSKLRSEIKAALYDRVLKPQTAALMDYLHHTAKVGARVSYVWDGPQALL